VDSATLLVNGARLSCTPGAQGVAIAVPRAAPSELSSTVVLTMQGRAGNPKSEIRNPKQAELPEA
jgi:hypothetical protein